MSPAVQTLIDRIGSGQVTAANARSAVANAGGDAFVILEAIRELAAGGSGDLLAANNLSDLADTATARGNLGLGAAAVLGASAGGLEAADSGKVPTFGANGSLKASISFHLQKQLGASGDGITLLSSAIAGVNQLKVTEGIATDVLQFPIPGGRTWTLPTSTGTVALVSQIPTGIADLSGTMAQFNTACTDGDFGFLGAANAWTAANTLTTNALGTTPTAGFSLINSTAAAAGAQQVSPSLRWTGQGWKTNATAASQTVYFESYVLPVQGAANPSGTWLLRSSINGGALATVLSIASTAGLYVSDVAGVLTLQGGSGSNTMQFSTAANLMGYLYFNNSTSSASLTSDGAGNLAIRGYFSPTTAQSLRMYRTYTDASNYERMALQSGSGYFEIAAETAGTGTDNIDLRLTPAGAGLVMFGSHSAVGAETVTGFITIKDNGGTSRKLAVLS